MRSRSLLAILVIPLLLAAPGVALGQDPARSSPSAEVAAPAPALTSIAGEWRFNPIASDNEQAKVRQGRRGGGGGWGGAGRMPGNPGGVNQARPQLQPPEALSIVRREVDVVISDGRRRAQVFATDGKQHPLPGGNPDQQATVKARWTGDKLEVERRMARGNGTREIYELSRDRRQLIVTVRVATARNTMTLKRVYDPQPR